LVAITPLRAATPSVESVTAAAATIENRRAVHVLVNTAAVLRPGALDILSLPNGTRSSVNLTGYFVCAQIFAGRCATSAAQPGSRGFDRRQQRAGQSGAYSVSKAGVIIVATACQRVDRTASAATSSVRHGDHADEPVVLRYAGVTERRSAWCDAWSAAADMLTRSCSSPATARPISTATRSRSMAATPIC
jgi:hypothetical protein